MDSTSRKFSAKEIVGDIRSGMKRDELQAKYELTPSRLTKLLDRLVEMKALDKSELDPSFRRAEEPEPRSSEEDNSSRPGDWAETSGERYFLGDTHAEATEGPERLWSIKLYGKTTQDRVGFCKDLAAVLGMSPRETEELYDKCPVVIKSGLTEDRAERLRSILASIGALCIAEQRPAEETTEKQYDPGSAFAFPFQRNRESGEEGLLPTKLKASSIVLLVIVLLLCVFGWHLVNVTAPVREYQATTGSIHKKKPELKDGPGDLVFQPLTLEDLNSDAQRLEADVQRLEFVLQVERAAFNDLRKSVYSESKFETMLKKDQEIKAIQNKLAEKIKDLGSVRKRIHLLEQSEAPTPNE
jgi:ribosomal protein L7/L12